MTTRVYDVPEITCDHCKNFIEAEVTTVAGVTEVEVTVATKSVRVEGTADDVAIRAAINEAGYTDIR